MPAKHMQHLPSRSLPSETVDDSLINIWLGMAIVQKWVLAKGFKRNKLENEK